MQEQVRWAVRDGIAEMTLDRPHKLNAMTPAMARQLGAYCLQADDDEAVRVVVIRGEGARAFCAGTDLNSLADYTTAWQFRNRQIEYGPRVFRIRKPVIAALRGWVLGGGAEIALGADFRVADHSMRFGFPEVTRGWVGGGGGSQLLPRLIGYGAAMRLLTQGEIIDAAEAYRLGVVEYLVDDTALDAQVQEIAQRLLALSPVAVQSVKASVRASMSMPLESGLRYENEMNTLCFSAGDHLEGIEAFREKRDARFER